MGGAIDAFNGLTGQKKVVEVGRQCIKVCFKADMSSAKILLTGRDMRSGGQLIDQLVEWGGHASISV